jgi:hypothetical protein
MSMSSSNSCRCFCRSPLSPEPGPGRRNDQVSGNVGRSWADEADEVADDGEVNWRTFLGGVKVQSQQRSPEREPWPSQNVSPTSPPDRSVAGTYGRVGLAQALCLAWTRWVARQSAGCRRTCCSKLGICFVDDVI